MSVPYEQGKPIYPFYGPVSLGVSIDKEDESLSSYHFKAYYDRREGTLIFFIIIKTILHFILAKENNNYVTFSLPLSIYFLNLNITF